MNIQKIFLSLFVAISLLANVDSYALKVKSKKTIRKNTNVTVTIVDKNGKKKKRNLRVDSRKVTRKGLRDLLARTFGNKHEESDG